MKSVYVIEVGIYENEIFEAVTNLLHFISKKRSHFRPQQVASRVAGDVDGCAMREIGILPPQLGAIFTPGKQMRCILYRQGESRREK